jgi:cellobiose transport system substrate-binding protein
MNRSWARRLRVVAIAATSAALLAACGGGGGGTGSPSSGPITLTINFWGDFGLNQLKPAYEALHPNIKLVLNSGDYSAQHDLLQQKIVAGSGAPDIAAIDEGFIVKFRSQSDKFVNLLDMGAASYESKYLGWKWKQSLSADGKTQIGLGTDVGGLAMCYRTDLFQAAGLPTDRTAVSNLWKTWDDFINVGKQYVAKTKKHFVDNATNIFNPVLSQQPVGFYDTNEQLQMDGGPKVAFDTAVKVYEAGLSANLPSFAAGWDKGFVNGDFAVLACPAWMLGHIQQVAPDEKGKWDIAAIPGGGGNWGGSFWTIPKQGKHIKEAYDFITWAVDPAQQIKIFQTVGNLPSQPALYSDPSILAYKNEFFNNAPVGTIFASTAQNLTAQYLGKKNGNIRTAVENVINSIQGGQTKVADGWAKAVADAQKADQA